MSRIDKARQVMAPRAMTSAGQAGRLALALVILLIAFNLRPAVSSLSPVLAEVMASTGLSATGASLLSMGQVLCLGLFAAAAPWLVRRFALERAGLICLAAVAIGSVLRGFGDIVTLAIGSVLSGAGIGAANVVLPGLLKRDFADRTALMAGLYSMALCLGGALAIGTTAPLRLAFGGSWPWALEVWALPALVAFVCAAVVWRGAEPAMPGPARSAKAVSLWRDPLAWQVTFYMGLQSMLAYSMFSWLAPILRSRGDDAVTAGVVPAVAMIVQVIAALPAPILAARLRRQSVPAAMSMAFTLTGFLGMLYLPLSWQWLFAVLLGIGMGGAFGTAVLFLVLRAPNAAAAARLSSMAQAVGYSVASLGPLGIGLAHDVSGDWTGALAIFVFACTAGGTAGFLAGRNRLVRG
jgi:CP family cyanate transporter-like MFS transporter